MADINPTRCSRPSCASGLTASKPRRLCSVCFALLAGRVARRDTTWEALESIGECRRLHEPLDPEAWQKRQELIKQRYNLRKEQRMEEETRDEAEPKTEEVKEVRPADENGKPKRHRLRPEELEKMDALLRRYGPSLSASEAIAKMAAQGVAINTSHFYNRRAKMFQEDGRAASRAPAKPQKASKAAPKAKARPEISDRLPVAVAGLQEALPAVATSAQEDSKGSGPATKRIRFKMIDFELEGDILPADLLEAAARALTRG